MPAVKMSSLMASRSVMLWASFVLAVIGTLLAPPILYPVTHNNTLTAEMFLVGCCIVGPMWILFAVLVLCHYRKRGLWVLLGLPFALCCPGLMFLLLLACSTGHACL
jgi:hypothetical protein